jgi:hypothetical protein
MIFIKSVKPTDGITVTVKVDTDHPDDMEVSVVNESDFLLIANAPMADAVINRSVDVLEELIDQDIAAMAQEPDDAVS